MDKKLVGLIAAGSLAIGAMVGGAVGGDTKPKQPPLSQSCDGGGVQCSNTKTCAPSCSLCPLHHC